LFWLAGLDWSGCWQNIEDEGVAGKILRINELEALRRTVTVGRRLNLFSGCIKGSMRVFNFSVKVVRHSLGCGKSRVRLVGGKSRFLTGLSARFGMTRIFGGAFSPVRNDKSRSRFLTGLCAQFGMTKAKAGSSPGFLPDSE